jgi:asparagine N-glycosylation enzyme membrane subunit Stt3
MIKSVFKILKLMFIAVVVTGAVYKGFLEEGLHAIPIILWSVFLLVLFPAAIILLSKKPYFAKLSRDLDKTAAGKAFLILVLIGIIAFVVISLD